jgi:regulator of replication initiation timing
MPGKPSLLTQLTDELGGLRAALSRALADNRITAAEAADLKERVDRAHIQSQRCDIAQRDGLSRARYGEPTRDTLREMAQLETMTLERRLRGRTRKSA